MTTTASPAPLTLDRTVSEFYPKEQRDREHTSFVISSTTMVFMDPEDAFDYLTEHKGLPFDRAELVINRRCEFAIEESEGLRFTTYRFRRA